MNAADVEATVRSAADEVELQVTAQPIAADGYLELMLAAPEAGDRRARIATDGAEMFLLRLDGRYDLREFDWELVGQQQILRTLVALAGAHLRGSSEHRSQRRRLRRDREFLAVTHDGKTFYAMA